MLIYLLNVPVTMFATYRAYNSDIKQLYINNAEKFNQLAHAIEGDQLWIFRDHTSSPAELKFSSNSTGYEGRINELTLLSEPSISFLNQIISSYKFKNLYSNRSGIRLPYSKSNDVVVVFLCFSSDGKDNSNLVVPVSSREKWLIWIADNWYIYYLFPRMI